MNGTPPREPQVFHARTPGNGHYDLGPFATRTEAAQAIGAAAAALGYSASYWTINEARPKVLDKPTTPIPGTGHPS